LHLQLDVVSVQLPTGDAMQALVAALGHLNRALRTARIDFDGLLETPERVPIGAQQILEKEYLYRVMVSPSTGSASAVNN
jgi:hypothetical protein